MVVGSPGAMSRGANGLWLVMETASPGIDAAGGHGSLNMAALPSTPSSGRQATAAARRQRRMDMGPPVSRWDDRRAVYPDRFAAAQTGSPGPGLRRAHSETPAGGWTQ